MTGTAGVTGTAGETRARGDAGRGGVPGALGGAADERAGAVFAALADPTRRAMLHTLRAEPEATASRLAGELPMTRQAVSKHLGALARAGLVEARREGRETRYTLTPAPLAEAMEWMADAGGFWDRRLDRLADRARQAPE